MHGCQWIWKKPILSSLAVFSGSSSLCLLYIITIHYNDVIMSAMASQITSLTVGLLNGLFWRRSKKTSKLRVTALWPVNSPHKRPVTREMFPFDDVIMSNFTEVCSQGFNWQFCNIDLGNGLAPIRRQAIAWTNADPVHRRIYAALPGDELKIIIPFDIPPWQYACTIMYIITYDFYYYFEKMTAS